MSTGKRSTDDAVADIKAAAYMFTVEKRTLAEIASMMGKSRRTLSRWRKTRIWADMVDLIQKEG